jgi:hypothetical protein
MNVYTDPKLLDVRGALASISTEPHSPIILIEFSHGLP